MPRNKRNSKRGSGTNDATSGVDMAPARGRGGTGAFSPDISTRMSDVPTRGEGAPVEFGGVRYFGHELAPVRQDRIQTVCEAHMIDLVGYHWVDDGGTRLPTIAQRAKVYAQAPGYRTVANIWDNGYDLLRQRAEDAYGYRHLPSTLHDAGRLLDYCQLYMSARLMLGELTSWQKMHRYDLGHISAGKAADRISRGRINGLWEMLGSFPMFPGLVQLADLKARAVIESPTGIVYHSQWPFPSNHYWWGLTWDNPQLSAPVAGQISYGTWDRGTSWDPSSVFTYQRIASTVETILDVLNRTHPDMSDNDRSDVQNIQTLFRMLELPQAPMNWNNWVPTMLDFGMVDTLLYRGAWVGVDNTSLLGDNVLVYPRIDDLSGLVEVRGRGTPNPLTVAGLMNPLTVIRDAANWNVSSGYFFIGAVGYNQLNQANYAADVNKSENGLHRLIRKFTQEDGWTNATSSYRAVAVQQTDPLRHHQYSVRGQVDVDTIVDVDVNDSVDYSFYVPVEDVGYHYLAWLSQTLGLPYLGG